MQEKVIHGSGAPKSFAGKFVRKCLFLNKETTQIFMTEEENEEGRQIKILRNKYLPGVTKF